MNDHGVDRLWDWLFGKGEKPETDEPEVSESSEEPEFLTRKQQIDREQAALKERLQQTAEQAGEADQPDMISRIFRALF